MNPPYDAVLVISFGGPDRPEDVIPFLENVLRGKNVPRERMLAVAEHYSHFGGLSPINSQNRELIRALEEELKSHGPELPVYWGNRNWHPFLTDTLRQMKAEGVQRALGFVTSVFGSYSGCRQYLEDIERSRAQVEGSAPVIDKLRCPFNHPGFISATADRVRAALAELPEIERAATLLVFTAHSIPVVMAATSPYEAQLRDACALVSAAVGRRDWALVYQSRSGPPGQAWLGPDVCDYLRELHARRRASSVVLVPVGFISDHMEVRYDLDTEARAVCEQLGLPMVRAGTVGSHPRFVTMIRQLIEERSEAAVPLSEGPMGPSPHVCPAGCCAPVTRPATPSPHV